MATTEKVISQFLKDTSLGSTFERRFSSTFADYNVGVLVTGNPIFRYANSTFPFRIGDALSYDSLSFPISTLKTDALRVSEIDIDGVDNVNIIATIFYSNVIPAVSQEMEPDTNASWQESFSINSQVTTGDLFFADSAVDAVDRFIDRVDRGGLEKDWSTIWTDAGKTTEKPDNEIMEPNWVFTATTYSKTLLLNRIVTAYNSVNAENFLTSYFIGLANRNGVPLIGGEPSLNVTDWAIPDPDGTILDDTGRWLFKGCEVNRARFDSWQYDWTFEFNLRWKWNEPYGITVDKYPVKTFSALFLGMTGPPEDGNLGAVRT